MHTHTDTCSCKRENETSGGPAHRVIRCQERDPDILSLVPGFVAALSGQCEEMLRLKGAERWEELQRLLHGMKGAGGMFGFPELTEQAARAEDRLRMKMLEEARVEVEEMAALIRRVEGFGKTVV